MQYTLLNVREGNKNMTIFEWLDKEGYENVQAELVKMVKDITGLTVTCKIIDEFPEDCGIAFAFELEDDSYLYESFIYEEEDEEFTPTRILKNFAYALYNDYCENRYYNWTEQQRQFIDAIHEWA